MNKFYDTCSLLILGNKILKKNNKFYISSITLNELESIKTSSNKDFEIKAQARQLLRLLDANDDKYEVIIFNQRMLTPFLNNEWDLTNDLKILACAYTVPDVEFITNDLALKQIAKNYFSNISSVGEEKDDYTGYKELILNDEELANLYSNLHTNIFNLQVNEYLILKNSDNEIIDTMCWTGDRYRQLHFKEFSSKHFGKIRPKVGDVYQRIAADSLYNNQITMLKGPAGSGKTILSLGYLMHKLERGEIDKIIVFCNTVATKNSARLGLI